jgi:uncharacterized membrane protein (DUF4010 family)
MPISEILVRIILASALFLIILFRKRLWKKFPVPKAHLAIKVLVLFLLLLLLSPQVEITLGMLGVTDTRLTDIILINPYYFFSLVTLVVSIQAIGLLLIFWLGPRASLTFVGFVGGFTSSTAITQIYGLYSRENGGHRVSRQYASAVVLADGSSMFEKMLLVAVSNIGFLPLMLPYMISHLLVGLYAGFSMLDKHFEKETGDINKYTNYFSLFPVFWLAVILFVVGLATQLVPALLDGNGEVLAAGISLAGGLNPTIIEVSKRYPAEMSLEIGTLFILIAFTINIIGKYIFAFILGTREYFKEVLKGLTIILIGSTVVGILAYLIQYFVLQL